MGELSHYARGGPGPALILLHGFPQDWREWPGCSTMTKPGNTVPEAAAPP